MGIKSFGDGMMNYSIALFLQAIHLLRTYRKQAINLRRLAVEESNDVPLLCRARNRDPNGPGLRLINDTERRGVRMYSYHFRDNAEIQRYEPSVGDITCNNAVDLLIAGTFVR